MGTDLVIENIPNLPVNREGESFIGTGRNNQLIIFKRDRPGGVDSGHGDERETGTIHAVVGRSSQDTSFADDDAFIYMSMKTDVDVNLSIGEMTHGDGSSVGVRSGPAIIAKSDNIRFVHRSDGDLRISSEDGKNFIILSSNSCEIKLGSSWLKIEDGTITIEAGTIKLGSGASSDHVILGDSFMNDIFNQHTHQSPVGPTSMPLLPMTPAQLSKKNLVE